MSKKNEIKANYGYSNFPTIKVEFTLSVPNYVSCTAEDMVKVSELMGELGNLLNCKPMVKLTFISQEDPQAKRAFSIQGDVSAAEA